MIKLAKLSGAAQEKSYSKGNNDIKMADTEKSFVELKITDPLYDLSKFV